MEILVALITLAGAILNIILFFKLWGMTNNVAEILDIIKHSTRAVPANSGIDPENTTTTDGSFSNGQVVVNLKNEDQLKITSINPDGTYSCVKNGTTTYVGEFKKEEIADFDAYWASKKR